MKKFGTHDGATQETKDLVAAIIKAIGGDVLYVNITDDSFRQKYNVPDFVKGTISAPKKGSTDSKSVADDETAF